VRGAPAIGVAAAYGLALAAERGEDLDEARAVLAASRPTAVNLSTRSTRWLPSPRRPRRAPTTRRRWSGAAAWPPTRPSCSPPGTRALTHCNAGGLATGGVGSAVGALQEAWERGLLEARPRRRGRAAPPGRTADRVGARTRGYPARGDRGTPPPRT
jgi:methylthioribose-1-phosphate isomerase